MRLLLLVFVGFAIGSDAADACSCVPRSFAEHAKTEKRVFLARAGKPVKTGDALKQKFTILATFKGDAATEFVFDRPATPPCASEYAEGDVAIIFSTDGEVDPCHGNESLDSQAPHLDKILEATRVAKKAADPKAIEAGKATALATYKRALKHVKIEKSFTAGALTFASGKIRTEGVRFWFLMLRASDGTWSVIRSSVVER